MKSVRNFFILSALLIIIFGVGYRVGSSKNNSQAFSAVSGKNITNKSDSSKGQRLDFSLFWDVWDKVSTTYVDKVAVDPQKMIYGAISGMVASLGDPYTVFLPPTQNKEAKDDLGGLFEGIGAQLGVKDKKIVVIAPLKGSPAEKAGLKPEDWITKVDGASTFNWLLPDAVSKIRGPKKTTVTLEIVRKEAEQPITLKVERDEIKVASVEWEVKYASCTVSSCTVSKDPCTSCGKVAYLKLGRFGDTTLNEWDKAVGEIVLKNSTEKLNGMVLDLRNNPGGYLSASVYIASEFLSSGKVVTEQTADGKKQDFPVVRPGKLLTNPLVVLINKGSASASEIVAGALKVRGRAKLIGETTFGKGSIQQAVELREGAGLHVTIAKWLLPDGAWINGKGIEPDTIISASSSSDINRDEALEKAVQILLQ